MEKKVFSVLVMAIFLGMVGGVSANEASCPSGMVAYWKFDEGSGTIAGDSVGGNDGTIYGANWIDGVAGSALSFNAECETCPGDYVLVKDSQSLNFGYGDFSMELWVKTSSDYAALIGKGTHGCDTNEGYGIWGSYNRMYFWINNRLSNSLYYDGGSYEDWTHITAVRQGNMLSMYLDGELVTKKWRNPIKDVTTTEDLYIGISNTICWDSLRGGSIDEAAIFNRALTADEIMEHYQASLEGSGYCPGDKNKGHGNDPDGVDEDNPGKGCENKNANGNQKRC
jgi:hypothetical protein